MFFFLSSSKINKYYFIIFTVSLLIFLGGPFWVEIFSNVCNIVSKGSPQCISIWWCTTIVDSLCKTWLFNSAHKINEFYLQSLPILKTFIHSANHTVNVVTRYDSNGKLLPKKNTDIRSYFTMVLYLNLITMDISIQTENLCHTHKTYLCYNNITDSIHNSNNHT